MPQPIALRVTEVSSGKHTAQTAQTASSLIQDPRQTKAVPREKSSTETSVNRPWLVRVWCQCAQGLTSVPLGPRSHRLHLGVQLAVSPRALPTGEAKAEAREPMTQADRLPGHSPGASCGATSTNPELSQRTTSAWHRGDARHLPSLPFLKLPGTWPSPEPHAAYMTLHGDFQDYSLHGDMG